MWTSQWHKCGTKKTIRVPDRNWTHDPPNTRWVLYPLSYKNSWRFLPKMCFLDILVVFRLNLGQISFNLVENAFATRQLALLATRIVFLDIWARAWADIIYSVDLLIFEFFFLPFLFLFFLLQWLTFYWACLQLKNFEESVIETGNFYHGAARCSGTKFCCEFFTQLFKHFCAYLRCLLANHSDLGIIAKIFSSSGSWVHV